MAESHAHDDVDDSRHFNNVHANHQLLHGSSSPLIQDGHLTATCRDQLKAAIGALYDTFNTDAHRFVDESDPSVYTGSAGIALMHWRMANSTLADYRDDALKECRLYMKSALDNVRGRSKDVTLLTGDSGPLAIGALLYARHPELASHRRHRPAVVERLLAKKGDVLNSESRLPNELLYGRAGYLSALLFLRHSDEAAVSSGDIGQVFNVIIDAGIEGAEGASIRSHCPLVYQWHDKHCKTYFVIHISYKFSTFTMQMWEPLTDLPVLPTPY